MRPLHLGVALTLILAALPFATGAQTAAPPSASAATQSIPVTGTFDRPSIVVAFYHSPQWAAILADRQYERNAAQSAHDAAKVKEIEAWGGARQELAMQQMAGKAPIANILEVLQPEFREISSRMKLTGIVESPGPDPKAATVDVTSLLLDWLKASQQTRKEAGEMHRHPRAE
jgi:hypothetical protein